MRKTIVITGVSSGIGFELAKSLSRLNNVIGISRTNPNLEQVQFYACDITKEDDLQRVMQTLSTTPVDVLIHCAGVGTGGAIEDIPVDKMKWVFDVNMFGVMNVTALFLPNLRQTTTPKIIIIGSVAGEITIPYQITYSMSKSAIHRYAEGLHMELKGLVDVAVVLPGDTKTGFTKHREIMIPDTSFYRENATRSIAKMAKDEENGVSPLKVVRVIERLIRKRKMPRQVIVGLDYKLLVFLSRMLPHRVVDFIIFKLYG